MRKIAESWFVAICLMSVFFAAPACGASFDEGRAAFERGDYAAAQRLWGPLADQGDARAQYGLGFAFQTGLGAPQNQAMAAKLYRESAEQGLVVAQIGLAYIYGVGTGAPTDTDYVESYMWLEIAAKNLPRSEAVWRAAAKLREAVAAKMTPAQISTAQKRAGEWTPRHSNVTQIKPLSANAVIATNDQLDALLAARNWNGLKAALFPMSMNDAESYVRQLAWLRDRIFRGGGFFLGMIYANQLWAQGNADKVEDPQKDWRQSAAVFFLYTYELIVIDGAKCEDRTAPSHRADQLFSMLGPILPFLKAQAADRRTKVVDFAITLEKRTAPLRVDDDLLCRDGMAQMKAGLENGKQREVTTPTGHIGKTVEVEAPAGWTPKLLAPEVYRPLQEKARADAIASLRALAADAPKK